MCINDIRSEILVTFNILDTIADQNRTLLSDSLIIIENELQRSNPGKEQVGQLLDKVLENSKKKKGFSGTVESLTPHIIKLVKWLGKDWQHIVNLLDSNELGKKYPVVIEKYNPAWKKFYKKETEFFKSQFNTGIVIRTEHFGSTAIPGLAAKPSIDILVEVTSFEDATRDIVPYLENKGYCAYCWNSKHPPGHMFFAKGYGKNGYLNNVQIFHYHMAPGNHPIWERLLFRDYLCEYPDIAKRYEKLKLRLSKLYPHDREAYTDKKSEFVNSVTEKAKQYYK